MKLIPVAFISKLIKTLIKQKMKTDEKQNALAD